MSCRVCRVYDVGVLWPNGWIDQDETWRAGRLGPGYIVLHGDQAPPTPKEHNPPIFGPYLFATNGYMEWIKTPVGRELGQFSAHVYFGQTAAWIR